MKRYDLIVVGAGPSGLSTAIEAEKKGMNVIGFDEMRNRADSCLNRYINFLVPKNTRQRYADLKSEKIC